MQLCCINMFASLLYPVNQPNALEVNSLDELSGILSEDINFTHYVRPIDENIHLFARILIAANFKGIDVMVSNSSVKQLIANHLDKSGIHTIGKVALVEDIVTLTHAFLLIIQQEHVRLHLKIVSDDAGRKFHTDRYDLRLLCTYVGAGTEWIDNQYVNRAKLVGGDNDSIIKDPSKIKTMQSFEVGILKGEASEINKGKGIVHRSPSIEQNNESRLLLRLDY
jgi:hypothetical protein